MRRRKCSDWRRMHSVLGGLELTDEKSKPRDTTVSRGLSGLFRRWLPALILGVLIIGTVWVTFTPQPEHTQAAHTFQTSRRQDDWERVMELMDDEYQLRGGELHALAGYLDPSIAHTEFKFPGASARVLVARISEGLAVAETDWENQILCVRGDDDEGWRVAPTPFLLYYLEHGSFLERPDLQFSPASAMIAMPRSPAPGRGQARVLADPVWVRRTPEGTMRTLIVLRVSGQDLEMSLHSLLAAAMWSDDDEGDPARPSRLLWTDMFPSDDGIWPLAAGTWWVDLEWDQLPEGDFSLVLGTFASGDERRTLTMTGISPP